MITKLSFKKRLIIGSCLLGALVAPVFAQDMSASPEVVTPGQLYSAPAEQDPIPINYFGQPPLIPHSNEDYQLTRNANDCLKCHSPSTYRTARSPRVSGRHLRGGVIAPNYYFCMSCHVEQTNAPALVDNEFKPEN